MVRILVYIVVMGVAIIGLSQMVPDIVVPSYTTAFIAAVVWGLLSVTVRPILGILTLPINVLTFGLFTFILNAIMLLFVAGLIPGFEVGSFLAAIVGAAILMVVSWVVDAIF